MPIMLRMGLDSSSIGWGRRRSVISLHASMGPGRWVIQFQGWEIYVYAQFYSFDSTASSCTSVINDD